MDEIVIARVDGDGKVIAQQRYRDYIQGPKSLAIMVVNYLIFCSTNSDILLIEIINRRGISFFKQIRIEQ